MEGLSATGTLAARPQSLPPCSCAEKNVKIWHVYHRLAKLSKTHTFFLFGARGTGKSELLKKVFSPQEALFLDLLDPELADLLAKFPNQLLKIITPLEGKKSWIIIDEIQKVPALLDIVHQQLGKKKFKFALTGSSARKLKRGGANLLAGRGFVFHLFPLTFKEMGSDFDLDEALHFGALPEVKSFTSNLDKSRFLKAYTQTYLQEEIISEQIVRNLPPFRRFLDVVGSQCGQIVNYTHIARDILSDSKTVMRYFEILEDTWLGFYLPSYDTSIRKQQKKQKKFYLFDTGVARVLAKQIDQPLSPKTYEYGQMFETFIINEIYRLLTYSEKQFKLSFLKVSEKQEIDLIVEKSGGETYLCEIKSTDRVNENHLGALAQFERDFKNAKLRVLSHDPIQKKFGNILCQHWKETVDEIVSG